MSLVGNKASTYMRTNVISLRSYLLKMVNLIKVLLIIAAFVVTAESNCNPLLKCSVPDLQLLPSNPDYYYDNATLAAFCSELQDYKNCVDKGKKNCDHTYTVIGMEHIISVGNFACSDAGKKAVDKLTESGCVKKKRNKFVEKALSKCTDDEIGEHKTCSSTLKTKRCLKKVMTHRCGEEEGKIYGRLVWEEIDGLFYALWCSANQPKTDN
ncbi:uncharacterized protein LOC131953792 isoform X2 [Physella acuta]|uniref:uncharacterized protein LOC131953792 isoform X2 n=1 Tax=Physella acuta TaxID=109671 RepID=UPI0027DCFEE1|nr:uncharacterized protein LOC131953792 isoform X2 [Physella acuta]